MKNILVCLLLISSLCSFTKKKKEREGAVKKGSVTAFVAAGYPKMARLEQKELGSPVLYIVGAEYQASRRFCFGLQFSNNYSATGMLPVQNYFSGTVYQHERWATFNTYMVTVDYCYLNKGMVSLGAGIGFGMEFSRFSEHVIDSAGISTHHMSHLKELAGRLRLVDAKLRITKNFGVYAGLGLGYDGVVAVGAHYTFIGGK